MTGYVLGYRLGQDEMNAIAGGNTAQKRWLRGRGRGQRLAGQKSGLGCNRRDKVLIRSYVFIHANLEHHDHQAVLHRFSYSFKALLR
ncbi:MAG: hypothetical protein VW877_14870 [Pseudomonadaceae bacterium]